MFSLLTYTPRDNPRKKCIKSNGYLSGIELLIFKIFLRKINKVLYNKQVVFSFWSLKYSFGGKTRMDIPRFCVFETKRTPHGNMPIHPRAGILLATRKLPEKNCCHRKVGVPRHLAGQRILPRGPSEVEGGGQEPPCPVWHVALGLPSMAVSWLSFAITAAVPVSAWLGLPFISVYENNTTKLSEQISYLDCFSPPAVLKGDWFHLEGISGERSFLKKHTHL